MSSGRRLAHVVCLTPPRERWQGYGPFSLRCRHVRVAVTIEVECALTRVRRHKYVCADALCPMLDTHTHTQCIS